MSATAVVDLRNAESNALSRSEPSYGSDSNSNSNSGSGGGLYTGSGRSDQTKKKKGGIRARTAGAIISIALLLGGGAAFLSSSNSLLVPALEALVTESTDTQYTSASLRSTRLMSYYLKTANNATTTNWRGLQKYTHMSNSFKQRLSNNGIEIEGTGANKTLVYTKITDTGTSTTHIPASSFETEFADNLDFREAYTNAKRGRVATFFDNAADTIYTKLGTFRNWFSDFQSSNDSAQDKTKFEDTMSSHFDTDSTGIKSVKQKEETITKTEYDSDGNAHEVTITKTSPDSSGLQTGSGDTPNAKAASMIEGVSRTVGQVGNWACTISRVGGMISVAIAANEIYQSINYFMGFMENVSKTKAGYGDQSAIHEVLNFLSTPASTETTNFGTLKISGQDSNATASVDTLSQNGTPLEATGVQMMLANAPASNVSNTFSLERVTKALGGAITTSTGSALVCTGVDIAQNLISIGTQIGAAIASGGTSIIANILVKTVVAAATQIAVSTFLSFLIPTIAQAFFTNAFEAAAGVPAGELFARGASASNTRVGRSGSGQSLSSKDAALAYNQATNVVLALDAEVDRNSRSPFDASSKNTFFGSIAYSLLPIFTSSGATSLSSFLRSASSSLSSIIGKAHAAGEDSSYMTTFGNCPNLESIGATGDIYCNPITTTDVKTINLDPADPQYNNIINQETECDENGDCKIKTTGDLAKYITYCDGRNSPFGVVDQNILGALQPSNAADVGGTSVVSTTLNSIPFISDITNLVDDIGNLANMSWATGEKCGNTEANQEFWNSKGKYYQRYVEDMRLLDNMGAFEDSKNPVLAYETSTEQEYLEQHPEANTYIGYLSRISGLTRENTEIVLAFIEYYNFVDQYDSATRIAMTGHVSEPSDSAAIIAEITASQPHYFNNHSIHPAEPVIIADKQLIIYADLRNRSYVA